MVPLAGRRLGLGLLFGSQGDPDFTRLIGEHLFGTAGKGHSDQSSVDLEQACFLAIGVRIEGEHGVAHKLFQLELLKSLQKSFRPIYCHSVVSGIFLARQVEIGSEVNAGGDAVAIGQPHTGKRRIDAGLIGDVEAE